MSKRWRMGELERENGGRKIRRNRWGIHCAPEKAERRSNLVGGYPTQICHPV